MCVPILNVHRDQAGDITHIGGSTPDGRPWGLTLSEAISRIQLHVYDFVVTVPIGFTVPVVVRTRPNGRNYLTTSPDGVLANNLDNLPMIQTPLAGVDPPYPLSIPDLLDRFVV